MRLHQWPCAFNSAAKDSEDALEARLSSRRVKKAAWKLTRMTLARKAQKAWVRIQHSSNYYGIVGSCLMVKVNRGEVFHCQVSDGSLCLGTARNVKMHQQDKSSLWSLFFEDTGVHMRAFGCMLMLSNNTLCLMRSGGSCLLDSHTLALICWESIPDCPVLLIWWSADLLPSSGSTKYRAADFGIGPHRLFLTGLLGRTGFRWGRGSLYCSSFPN